MYPTTYLPRASAPVMSYGFDLGGAVGDAWDRYGPQVIDAAGRAVTTWATDQLTGGGSGGSAPPATYYQTAGASAGAQPFALSPALLALGAAALFLLAKGGS